MYSFSVKRLVRPRLAALAASLAVVACGAPENGERANNGAASARSGVTAPASPPVADASPAANPVLAALPEPYASADLANGRTRFRQCSVCHMVAAQGRHGVGPNLHGVFDRDVGVADGFRYSPALQNADFAWTPERLDQWLADPRDYLPGNRMAFAGVPQASDRRDIIAYLLVESRHDAAGATP